MLPTPVGIQAPLAARRLASKMLTPNALEANNFGLFKLLAVSLEPTESLGRCRRVSLPGLADELVSLFNAGAKITDSNRGECNRGRSLFQSPFGLPNDALESFFCGVAQAALLSTREKPAGLKGLDGSRSWVILTLR